MLHKRNVPSYSSTKESLMLFLSVCTADLYVYFFRRLLPCQQRTTMPSPCSLGGEFRDDKSLNVFLCAHTVWNYRLRTDSFFHYRLSRIVLKVFAARHALRHLRRCFRLISIRLTKYTYLVRVCIGLSSSFLNAAR